MTVDLYKKTVSYQDKNGNDKVATNFYVKCGDQLVPVEVKYFPDKETDTDRQYGARKTLMSAFATVLPDKKGSGKNSQKAPIQEDNEDEDDSFN